MKGGDHYFGGSVTDEDLKKLVGGQQYSVLDKRISIEWTVGLKNDGNTFFFENEQNRDTPNSDAIKEGMKEAFMKTCPFKGEGKKVDETIPLEQVRKAREVPTKFEPSLRPAGGTHIVKPAAQIVFGTGTGVSKQAGSGETTYGKLNQEDGEDENQTLSKDKKKSSRPKFPLFKGRSNKGDGDAINTKQQPDKDRKETDAISTKQQEKLDRQKQKQLKEETKKKQKKEKKKKSVKGKYKNLIGESDEDEDD
eukprot:Platyproteum_vivax@DN8397_c0_g1_i1.p1